MCATMQQWHWCFVGFVANVQKPQIANIKDKKKRDTNNKIRESEEAALRKWACQDIYVRGTGSSMYKSPFWIEML